MTRKSQPAATWTTTTASKPWKTTACAIGKVAGGTDLEITGNRLQHWEGFGGCFNEIGWDALVRLSADTRTKVMRNLFDPAADGLRLNIGRIPIGASDYGLEWYSCDETPNDFDLKHFSIDRDRGCLLKYIHAATAIREDITFFASPWSPPTWLKHPRAHNFGTLIWEKKHLETYARYFVKFVQAYAKEGVHVAQVHPQNEPVADQKFPSCLWTGSQMRDFIRDFLAPALTKAGLDTEVWIGTLNTDDFAGWPMTILSDPKAAARVSGIGLQWAGKGMAQRIRQSYPAMRMMQTENECGDGQNTWDYALYVFGLIQHYLSNGASGYVYWNMVLPPGGNSTWGWKQNTMVTVDPAEKSVTYNPEYYVMKHVARHVEPGAYVIGLDGPLAGTSLAFENPDGSFVAAVCNPLTTPIAATVSLGGSACKVRLEPRSIGTLVLNS